MATEVKLPELGDGIESGDVLEIFVSVGDVITAGQDIVEMETDKATVPVPASVGGKVTKVLVSEGDTVPIGGPILEVEAAAGAETAAAAPPAPEPAAPEPTPEPEPEPEPPKVQAPPPIKQPPPAPKSAQPSPQPAAAPAAAASTPAEPAPATSAPAAPIAAGPAIRRFAREVGVDLSKVVGSGDNGRITREDILAVVRNAGASPRGKAESESEPETAPELPETDDFGPIRVERMNKIRKTIANQMRTSWTTVPRVTNFDDADITDLVELRASRVYSVLGGSRKGVFPQNRTRCLYI